MSANIRIVLVETSHPGNIGAVARAMKNMGLGRLYLVNPKSFPDDEATARASGAQEVLDNTVVTASLEKALEGCHLVMGARSRDSHLQWPVKSARQAAQTIMGEPTETEVALVFGRERCGLYNEELKQCHYHVYIPANPDYPSLNLAQAVQILSYELYTQKQHQPLVGGKQKATVELASHESMCHFYQHLERVMVKTAFLNPEKPKFLMQRLMKLYARARVDTQELNILRGILTAVETTLCKTTELP